MGWGAQQNHIHAGIDNFFVAVESDETVFVGNIHVAFFFQYFTAVIELVLKYIAQRHNLQVWAGI